MLWLKIITFYNISKQISINITKSAKKSLFVNEAVLVELSRHNTIILQIITELLKYVRKFKKLNFFYSF